MFGVRKACRKISKWWHEMQIENDRLKSENAELRELCVTAKARYETVESVLERTRAENAKLRQQLADVTESMGRVEERCAKLRELVKEALMANEGGTFWEYFEPYSFWAKWCKDARDLGVEL